MASRVTPEGIEAAIRALAKSPNQSLLKYWSTILTPREIIYDYAEGSEIVHGKLLGQYWRSLQPCKFILTQKRLIFANRFLGSDDGKELSLRRIKAVDTRGYFPRLVHITYGKDAMELEIRQQGDPENFSKKLIQICFGIPPDGKHNLGWYSEGPSQRTQRSNTRQPIPAHVKRIVWERDNGQCVQCGSRTDLHFDHMIPVSLGGGNSVENIQVLCQHCNLRKSNRIDG